VDVHAGPPEEVAASRPTTLGYALLALLARESLTGYGLTQRMRDPIGLFWEPQHSQIYPELARLERAGLIAATAEPGPGPRPKRTYRLSDAGLDTLRAWVAEPPRLGGRRDELLLKIYASWVAEPSVTLELVRAAERHHAAQLARYLTTEARVRARGEDRADPTDPTFTNYATLRRGIGFERGRLAWCRWLIRRLKAANG
jgi:DNA-binding PadR family transcriptional regulator